MTSDWYVSWNEFSPFLSLSVACDITLNFTGFAKHNDTPTVSAKMVDLHPDRIDSNQDISPAEPSPSGTDFS